MRLVHTIFIIALAALVGNTSLTRHGDGDEHGNHQSEAATKMRSSYAE